MEKSRVTVLLAVMVLLFFSVQGLGAEEVTLPGLKIWGELTQRGTMVQVPAEALGEKGTLISFADGSYQTTIQYFALDTNGNRTGKIQITDLGIYTKSDFDQKWGKDSYAYIGVSLARNLFRQAPVGVYTTGTDNPGLLMDFMIGLSYGGRAVESP